MSDELNGIRNLSGLNEGGITEVNQYEYRMRFSRCIFKIAQDADEMSDICELNGQPDNSTLGAMPPEYQKLIPTPIGDWSVELYNLAENIEQTTKSDMQSALR